MNVTDSWSSSEFAEHSQMWLPPACRCMTVTHIVIFTRVVGEINVFPLIAPVTTETGFPLATSSTFIMMTIMQQSTNWYEALSTLLWIFFEQILSPLVYKIFPSKQEHKITTNKHVCQASRWRYNSTSMIRQIPKNIAGNIGHVGCECQYCGTMMLTLADNW